MVGNNFFTTQVKKSICFSKQRLLIIIIAIFMGTAVSNAFLNVYFDIDNKMSKELKSYGANMILSAKNSDYVDIEDVINIKKEINSNKLLAFSPYLYFTPSYSSRQILVAGVNFDEFKKINKFLTILKGNLSPNEYSKSDSIYLGVDLANTLDKKLNSKLILNYKHNDKVIEKTFIVKGIFSSGDEIDAMAFINLEEAKEFSGIFKYSYVSLIVDDDFENLNTLSESINNKNAELKTIPSVSMKEGAILEKIKGLMFLISIVILIISSTSVNNTLSSIIFSRKKEISLHIALGANKNHIIKLFASEVFILTLIASLLGSVGGYLLAQLLGSIIFNASIDFRFSAFIIAILISFLFAAFAAFFPIRKALSIDIVDNLRGE
ncbi:ABC transporter permease [Campylobacter sp. MG1]|uniref:ABC transporter permease n=1 Tax=Campylobacter sp. MG1 TaxID=2976332 RepID=UPI00226CDE45|nr:FtsX-like permease family protein [Campylobacter sp. MG1]